MADPIGWPWLRTAEATRVLNRLFPDDLDADLERIRQQDRNDQIYTDAIRSWFRRTDAVKETRE